MTGDSMRFAVLLVLVLIVLLMVSGLSQVVYSDEDGGDRGEGEAEGGFAKSLGSFTWGIAPVLILGFVVYKYAFLYQSKLGIRLPVKYRYVLDLHIYTSIALGLTGLIHGYLFMNRATVLEYAIGGVILLLLVTGVLLRWSRNRRVKTFARLLHAQRLLAIILFILVAIHVGIAED